MSIQVAELLGPIPGDAPAGAYLRYDPLYEQLREARREDDQLPQGDWQKARKVAEWPLVVRLATDALAKRTKDVQVAAWLTEALLRREGFAGLRSGLELLRDLLAQYWDTVYPPIEDGDTDLRAAPLSWLGLKLDVAVNSVPLNSAGHSLLDHRLSREVPPLEEAESDSSRAADREARIAEGRVPPEDIERGFHDTPKAWYRALLHDADACLVLLGELDTFCTEHFTDPPTFAPLRQAVEATRHFAAQLLARKLELEPDAEPVEAAPAGATEPVSAAAVAAPPAAAAPVAAAVSGPRNAQEAGTWVAAAARHLRRETPTAPAPYLLLRALRWGELRASGRIDPRLLVAPPTELRSTLKGLLLDAAWPQLLEAGEEAMAQPYGRGWLDLQRYVLTAVDGLGPGYDGVGLAIRGSLRALLADLPALLEQTLMDDSPCANAETRAWLAAERMAGGGADVAPAEPTPAVRSHGRDPFEVAQARVRAGDAQSAIELLMREAAQEKSARSRFLRRVQAAEIMVGAGMEAVAYPVLRELLLSVEAHRLAEWEEGETIAQPLALLYRCAVRLDAGDVDANSLYEQICRLDPLRALHLRQADTTDEVG